MAEMSPAPSFAAMLLAGGRSARMGRDKALLDWHGQPLWHGQLEKLRQLGAARVVVSSRSEQNLEAALPAGAEPVLWLPDPEGDDSGPLGAITRCLDRLPMPVLVLAVDMPWMPAEFLRRGILERCQDFSKGLFYRRDRRFEPLAGLYTPAMLPLLKRALSTGTLSLQPLLAEAGQKGLITALEPALEDADLFRNANTPADWPV